MLSVTRRPNSHTNTLPLPARIYMVATIFLNILLWGFIGQASPSFAAPGIEITPEQIVVKADRIRFPAKGYQVDVKITSTKPEQDPVVSEYRILSKGNDRALLMTTAPAIDEGNILLMRDLDLWAFLSNLSQPVRLPVSQRLTGEVANGDLARANFAGDYNPKLIRTETIDGEEYYVLELIAARRGVTYNRVVYWVNQANFRPHKAEFYSLSKRLIKTCHYQSYKELGTEVRPTKLIMEDALHKDAKSVLDYRNMQLRDLPNKIFTKDYLKKLNGR